MEAAEEVVVMDQLLIIVFALFSGLATSFVAYRKGFFSFSQEKNVIEQKLRFTQVIAAFLIFLMVQLFILPVLLVSYVVINTGTLPQDGISTLSPDAQGWFNVAAMVLSFLLVLGFYRLQDLKTQNFIWNRGGVKDSSVKLKSFFLGAFSWLISYPVVVFVGQGISLFVYLFIGKPEVEQVAVKSLKITQEYPILYFSMILCMVFLVPVMEELLFRGFLQSWLRGKVSIVPAILVTSITFALFHFSYSQGISNLEYIAALLLLSGFLGYIYERERSLWASIGLHVTFNAISILIITLS